MTNKKAEITHIIFKISEKSYKKINKTNNIDQSLINSKIKG
jgi:hypothetical protein